MSDHWFEDYSSGHAPFLLVRPMEQASVQGTPYFHLIILYLFKNVSMFICGAF